MRFGVEIGGGEYYCPICGILTDDGTDPNSPHWTHVKCPDLHPLLNYHHQFKQETP